MNEGSSADANATPFAAGLDARAVALTQGRWASHPEVPWLHAEVGRRMAERLAWFKPMPRDVGVWWPERGGGDALIAQHYPEAQAWHVQLGPAVPNGPSATPSVSWWDRFRLAFNRSGAGSALTGPAPLRLSQTDMQGASLREAQVQLIWANMAMHAVAQRSELLKTWHRWLGVEGWVMFSTVGPDSLLELRELYAQQGWGPPHAPFVDMHDLGDELVQAGFADPVMDQEHLTLHWGSAEALLAELQTWGRNHAARRHQALRTPRWREQLLAALRARADGQGRVALTLEVVYGHAFKPSTVRGDGGEASFSVESLRATASRR